MALLVEAFSVIVRRDAIDNRFPGGWGAFQRTIPNSQSCHDEDLVRVGFLNGTDVLAYISVLEGSGLICQKAGQSVDFAVVDQARGPLAMPVPWLEVGPLQFPEMTVLACWLRGTQPRQLVAPDGWEFKGSLSQNPCPASKDRLKFLRREGDIEFYFDRATGKEVCGARPIIEGDTEAAMITRLERICHRAFNLDAKMRSLKAWQRLINTFSRRRQFNELQNDLIPEAARIANGPGCNLAFAHFTHGVVLRVLGRRSEAEESIRKANKLQAGDVATLRELVRCLSEQGKHQEALPFAREATAAGPADAGAWGNLAICLMQCGEGTEARRAIDYAIDLDPNDVINRHNRDELEACLKRTKK